MGLFSSKTLVCERCGKEYQSKISMGAHLCQECKKKQKTVQGYIDYAFEMNMDKYTDEQITEIIKHRDAILEKHSVEEGISEEELLDALKNYKNMTDEEAQAILKRVDNARIATFDGTSITTRFLAPNSFPMTLVDADDVFAVGYVSNHSIGRERRDRRDVIVCALFTNDPYIPILAMDYIEELSIFEPLRSKEGRNNVQQLFTALCNNLTYPVQEMKDLIKQIESDGTVKGNISLEYMIAQLKEAEYGTGIFNPKHFVQEIDYDTMQLLNKYGYIESKEIDEDMDLGGAAGKFWRNQIEHK